MTRLYLLGLLFIGIHLTTYAQIRETFTDFMAEELKQSLSANWCVERIKKREIRICYCAADTVSFISQLDDYTSNYPSQDILQINIKIQEKWTDDDRDRVRKKNRKIEDRLRKLDIYYDLPYGQFNDYRAYVPKIHHKRAYYLFEQLPYKTKRSEYSIFLSNNVPYLSDIYKGVDAKSKRKKSKRLNRELKETMVLIAYILELQDYVYAEDIREIRPERQERPRLSTKYKPYKKPE